MTGINWYQKGDNTMAQPKGRTEAGPAIHRRLMILKSLPHYPKNFIGVRQLQNLLAEYYLIHADIRTIQRDLNSLLPPAFPIDCDGRKPQGWRWQKDAHAVDLHAMDPQTALTFRMVDKFMAPLLPKATLTALAPYQEIAKGVLGYDPMGKLSTWAEKVAVFHRSEFLIPPDLDENLVATIYQALFEGKRLKARYRPKGEESAREYEVNPLGLVLADNIPYLVATLWDYRDVKQLPLPRFESVVLQDEPVTPPQGFSLQEYLNSGEFSYRQSDERITLKLRMAEDRALHLKETRLHPDQVWADVGDGTVEITAQVHDSLQLRFWLNGFGADVEVLEPLELREEFAGQARQLARYYRKMTAPSRHTASIARGDQP
jgi:predicted DNA-binding transcriptional regulator YafY